MFPFDVHSLYDHTCRKFNLYRGAFFAILAKAMNICINFCSFTSTPTSQPTLSQLRSYQLLNSKRLILIRHSQSIWNETLASVKQCYQFDIPRWYRVFTYFFRELRYFPTPLSLYFDTSLTKRGINDSIEFHSWLFSSKPEQQFKKSPEALNIIALLRGPHWKFEKNNDTNQNQNQIIQSSDSIHSTSNNSPPSDLQLSPTQTIHPAIKPAMLVTSHLRRTILTLSLCLHTRLSLAYKFNHSLLSSKDQIKDEFEQQIQHQNATSGVLIGIAEQNTIIGSINDEINDQSQNGNEDEYINGQSILISRKVNTSNSNISHNSITPPISNPITTTTTSSINSSTNNSSNSNNNAKSTLYESVFINSLCKEMSVNIDCISLTPVGQLPSFGNDDCNQALDMFNIDFESKHVLDVPTPSHSVSIPSHSASLLSNLTPSIASADSNDASTLSTTPSTTSTPSTTTTISTTSTPSSTTSMTSTASISLMTSTTLSTTSPISMREDFLKNCCDLTYFTSTGSSTSTTLLDEFSQWIFAQDNENFIVCGHSSWFRNFYRYFIPILPSQTIPNSNSSTTNTVYSSNHIANLLKKRKMPNTGCVSVIMKCSLNDNGDKIYWVEPDEIIPIWKEVQPY